jgi:mRNA interferase MazF
MAMVKQFEIYLVNLEPTLGAEIKKTRPCVVVSPNEMNKYIRTVIIAPMTTTNRNYKSRVIVEFDGKQGQIMLDQIRAIDKTRLIKKLGNLSEETSLQVSAVLVKMFS